MKMADPIIQLVDIIRKKLEDDPDISNPKLLGHLEKIISEDSNLNASLSKKITQTNRESSTGYQTLIEGGRVNIGGLSITLPESGKIDTALESVLQKFQSNLFLQEDLKQHTVSEGDEPFPKKILFLSANPRDEVSPYKEKEMSEVEDALYRAEKARFKKSKSAPVFEALIDKPNVRAADLSQTLSAIEPHIIHISGREKGIGNLIFENHSENKETKNSNQLLGELFQLLSTNTQCVILNGCYLEDQAMAIVRHIDCLIAISQDLEEKTSISFLVELYYHLGLGIPTRKAFQVSRNRLLRGNLDEYQLPIILEKEKETERRELEKALVDCNKKIEQDPNKSTLWIQSGNILKKLERFSEADEAYEKASSLDTENYLLRIKQGDALEEAGKYNQALIAYDQALVLEEKDYKIWLKRGRTLAKSKKYREALESYKNALALKPLPPDH